MQPLKSLSCDEFVKEIDQINNSLNNKTVSPRRPHYLGRIVRQIFGQESELKSLQSIRELIQTNRDFFDQDLLRDSVGLRSSMDRLAGNIQRIYPDSDEKKEVLEQIRNAKLLGFNETTAQAEILLNQIEKGISKDFFAIEREKYGGIHLPRSQLQKLRLNILFLQQRGLKIDDLSFQNADDYIRLANLAANFTASSEKIKHALLAQDVAYLNQHLSLQTIAEYDRLHQEPLLVACARASNTEAVRQILTHQKTNLDAPNEKRKSPLHYALRFENTAMLEMLLKAGANPNVKDKHGMTPLHYPLSPKQVEILLKYGADPKVTTNGGSSPLRYIIGYSISLGVVNLAFSEDPPFLDYAYRFDDIPLVLEMLLKAGADPNCADQYGRRVLHDVKNVQQLELLINHGADPNCKDKKGDPLIDEFIKYKSNDIPLLEALLKAKANPNVTNSSGVAPLHQTQTPEQLDLLLKYGADSNIKYKDGDTYLHKLVVKGDITLSAKLLEKSANPNLPDSYGRTPLHLANTPELVELLLKHGADPTLLTYQGNTPAICALLRSGRSDIFNRLHDASQGFDEIWKKTKMMAHRFGLKGQITIGNRTIQSEGFWPEVTWHEMHRSIQKWKDDPSFFSPYDAGQALITKEDMEAILKAIQEGIDHQSLDLNKIGRGDLTMLPTGFEIPGAKIRAHSTSDTCASEYHLEGNRGFGRSRPGITVYKMLPGSPLTHAEIMTTLSSIGNKPPLRKLNYEEIQKERAIYLRPPYMEEIDFLSHKDQHVGNCSWASAKLAFRAALYVTLLKKGVPKVIANQISLRMYKAWTAFDRSMALREYLSDPYLQQDEALLKSKGIDKKLILEKVYEKAANSRFAPILGDILAGMSLKQRGRSKETALHIAVRTRNFDQIKALLEQGLDVNQGNARGITPFHYACALGDSAIIKELLPFADLNQADKKGVTPLHLAAWSGNNVLLKLLLHKGADFDAVDENGERPIHYAAKNPNPTLVKSLWNVGSSLDPQDNKGTTPLHIACKNGHFYTIAYLLRHHANPRKKNNKDVTPLDLASQWNWPKLTDLITKEESLLPFFARKTPITVI